MVQGVTGKTTRMAVSAPRRMEGLRAALAAWWRQEAADWDAAIEAAQDSPTRGVDLWDDMPTVDSKAVARSSPLFEQYLGVPLEVKLIRKGGYTGIDDMISDLVPRMEQVMATARQNANRGQLK